MISAGAAAAAAFNLFCTGQMMTYSTEVPPTARLSEKINALLEPKPSGRSSAFQAEYRVDLTRGRWCFHDVCERSFPFEQVTDAELVLIFSTARAGPTITINRETGAYYRRANQSGGYTEVRGECTRRATPGLPKRRF
jgi:hypothetical protein